MKFTISLKPLKPVCGLLVLGLLILPFFVCESALAEERRIPLSFEGGHELNRNDYGRPINLMAAALGVTPEQFRMAFSGVHPSQNGPPSAEEQRKNKSALLSVLAPLGVSNDRMDEVANYYRFRRQEGETWPISPAAGYVLVENGSVKRIVVTSNGSGYNTPPRVVVQGMPNLALESHLAFDKEMRKNGAVSEVVQSRGGVAQ